MKTTIHLSRSSLQKWENCCLSDRGKGKPAYTYSYPYSYLGCSLVFYLSFFLSFNPSFSHRCFFLSFLIPCSVLYIFVTFLVCVRRKQFAFSFALAFVLVPTILIILCCIFYLVMWTWLYDLPETYII